MYCRIPTSMRLAWIHPLAPLSASPQLRHFATSVVWSRSPRSPTLSSIPLRLGRRFSLWPWSHWPRYERTSARRRRRPSSHLRRRWVLHAWRTGGARNASRWRGRPRAARASLVPERDDVQQRRSGRSPLPSRGIGSSAAVCSGLGWCALDWADVRDDWGGVLWIGLMWERRADSCERRSSGWVHR
jgi:hypothetical protein